MTTRKKIVLFDAVGTVIHTEPDVVTVYQQYGETFGSSLDIAQVKERFKIARQKLFSVDRPASVQTAGELVSSDTIEHDLWRRFIAEVFDDVPDSLALFDSLWDFFADAKNWRVHSDVAQCLERLKRRGCFLAIASNFDSRLLPVIDSFAQFKPLDQVFCSAQLGYRKPDPAFYVAAKDRISESLGHSLSPELITFVGDCSQNDFHGPRRQGWSAWWLDRLDESDGANFDGANLDGKNPDGKNRIATLTQLPDRVFPAQ